MSEGKVISVYVIFTVLSALLIAWVAHHWVGLLIGGIIPIAWWILCLFAGDEILLMSIRAQPLNVAKYSEIGLIITKFHKGTKMGMPSLWILSTISPMSMSVGISIKKSHIILTRGFLERLDDKVHLALVTRELQSIKSGLTANNTGVATLLWLILSPGKLGQFMSGREPGEPNVYSVILNTLPVFAGWLVAFIGAAKKKAYEVDREASDMMDNYDYVPYALMKLQEGILGSPFNCELPLTGCCTINPGSRDPYASLFRAHPPTPKRIDRLRMRSGGRKR
jgi:Zn-dependent protease with chaperone function